MEQKSSALMPFPTEEKKTAVETSAVHPSQDEKLRASVENSVYLSHHQSNSHSPSSNVAEGEKLMQSGLSTFSGITNFRPHETPYSQYSQEGPYSDRYLGSYTSSEYTPSSSSSSVAAPFVGADVYKNSLTSLTSNNASTDYLVNSTSSAKSTTDLYTQRVSPGAMTSHTGSRDFPGQTTDSRTSYPSAYLPPAQPSTSTTIGSSPLGYPVASVPDLRGGTGTIPENPSSDILHSKGGYWYDHSSSQRPYNYQTDSLSHSRLYSKSHTPLAHPY